VTLHLDDRTISSSFSQGMAHSEAPTVEDVLDSLMMDALAYTNAASFEDFAGDFGYDPDSRRAESIYNACGQIAQELVPFLGGQDEFNALAYDTERL
jgi:hypothetical protein